MLYSYIIVKTARKSDMHIPRNMLIAKHRMQVMGGTEFLVPCKIKVRSEPQNRTVRCDVYLCDQMNAITLQLLLASKFVSKFHAC